MADVRERCIRRNQQYGRLWHIGETRSATTRDDDGRVIASPHFELLDQDDDAHEPEDESHTGEVNPMGRVRKIENALKSLDPSDDSHWTKGGLPDLSKVQTLAGLPDISRGDITEVWSDFTRDVAVNQPS